MQSEPEFSLWSVDSGGPWEIRGGSDELSHHHLAARLQQLLKASLLSDPTRPEGPLEAIPLL